MKTNIRIINGNQIGGCITVISDDRTKIIIDFGESLPGSEINEKIDFDWQSERVNAVLFTHYHGDHTGRLAEIPSDVPIYMGEITYNVMLNINKRIRNENVLEILNARNNIHFIEQNETVKIGTIEITPYVVDHSAFDAYMFLVYANGEYILHTGDYRDHGHKGHTIKKDGTERNVMLDVIRYYVLDFGKRKVNALITEGTMLSRLGDKPYSEKEMLRDAEQYFKEHRYVFLKVSSTNVDSLASFEKAAKKNGMKMFVSGYLMDQIEVYRTAAEKHRTSMYAFDNVLPLLPSPENCKSDKQRLSSIKQREYMKKNGFVIVADGSTEKCFDEFIDLPVTAIYSMWSGYINPCHKAFNQKLYDFCRKTKAIPMHTSGHAYTKLIEQVIEAVNPTEAIIPIHTEAADELFNLNISQNMKNKIVFDMNNDKTESYDCVNELLAVLRAKYKNRSIKWPSKIQLNKSSTGIIEVTLDIDTIQTANMQEADNAFEGWVIAAYIGFGEESVICLDINEKFSYSSYEGNGHLCRFLYRAMKFAEQYEWFELSPYLKCEVEKFRQYLESNRFTNNLPNNEAGEKQKRNKEDFAEARLSESDTLKKQLDGQYDIGDGKVYRQLPVGLFRVKVSEANMVFIGNKAAIDMWSIKDKTFQMFELKSFNKMVGIVTEAFFYSNYILDLKADNGMFSINSDESCDGRGYQLLLDSKIDSVKGFLLADSFHPLVNDDLIGILNSGKEKHITYVIAKYDYDSLIQS